LREPEEKDTEERPQSSTLNQADPAGALVSDAARESEVEGARLQPLPGAGERRNPLTVLILGFLTCYIYLFYWWYATGVDIQRALGREATNPPLELVLNLLTCSLYSIYLSYKYSKLMLEMQERARVPPDDKSLVSVLLSLFSLGPVACYLIQTDLNRIWDRVDSQDSFV
jgi:hypothetical protein